MIDDLSKNAISKKTIYTDQYDPNLLSAINRDHYRNSIGIDIQDIPFEGVDVWNGFDLTWLNAQNLPEYGMLSIFIPCDSPNIIEGKSLKLYLYSFANSKFQSLNEIICTIEQDLSKVTGSKVKVNLANILLDFMHLQPYFGGINLDEQNISCSIYDVDPSLLSCVSQQTVTEQLRSDLLHFNSVVTGKSDWASIQISYTGNKIDPKGLLQYIVSYRNHKGLQEQCIEQIFCDISKMCTPSKLIVEGRYARRGGLDINPIRANTTYEVTNHRLFRE